MKKRATTNIRKNLCEERVEALLNDLDAAGEVIDGLQAEIEILTNDRDEWQDNYGHLEAELTQLRLALVGRMQMNAADDVETLCRFIGNKPVRWNAHAALSRLATELKVLREKNEYLTAEWKQALHDRDEYRHQVKVLLAERDPRG